MKVQAPSLAPILRSDTQGRILARLFADLATSYTLSELVSWAGSSMPTVQREVRRAEEAGIVTTSKIGPARLVQANSDHPLFGALGQVVLATYGPPAVVARELRGLARADAVLLIGSWAARYLGQRGRAPNDIDVLVIGSPDRDDVDAAAERAERTIGMPVQATIRSRTQWSDARDSFVQEVKRRPLVVVLADEDSADALPGGRLAAHVPGVPSVSWERGRDEVERLLRDGELERVTASGDVANRLLGNAEAHVSRASRGVDGSGDRALRAAPGRVAAASTPLEGWCDPRFAPVRAAFEANFADRGEVGAAVHVIVGGEVVVDLVGGWTDERRTRPWRHDTIAGVYSVGKAVLAVLALQLVDGGRLALDQPVADVWPEFASGGKAGATVAHALSHRAGVPAIRDVLTDDDLFDWGRMTAAIAATEAWSVPGERVAYHTNTFGHLVGELIHRASGEMPGERLRRVARSLGADVWFGVPATEQHRCADVLWAPAASTLSAGSFDGLVGDALMNALAHLNPPGYSSIGVLNTPAWRSLPLGSTSGHASASGVARIYAALLDPGRLVSPELLAQASTPQVSGHCPILGQEITYGLGFVPTTPHRPLGPNRRSFGHFGTGGALGFADPDAGVAFGYVMNHVIPRWQSTRNRALVDAVYASLARR